MDTPDYGAQRIIAEGEARKKTANLGHNLGKFRAVPSAAATFNSRSEATCSRCVGVVTYAFGSLTGMILTQRCQSNRS